MIGRANRFHGYNALRHVYGRGQTVRGTHLSLKYMVNPRRSSSTSSSSFRVAVVVSRKVHKSAVVRNRIRRRIYEIIRGQAGAFDQPYDLVFTIFSDQLAELPAPELRQLVESQLERASILKGEPRNANAATDDIVNAKERQ